MAATIHVKTVMSPFQEEHKDRLRLMSIITDLCWFKKGEWTDVICYWGGLMWAYFEERSSKVEIERWWWHCTAQCPCTSIFHFFKSSLNEYFFPLSSHAAEAAKHRLDSHKEPELLYQKVKCPSKPPNQIECNLASFKYNSMSKFSAYIDNRLTSWWGCLGVSSPDIAVAVITQSTWTVPSCVRPCMRTQKTTSPPWHRDSTGPGALTWEVWKVRVQIQSSVFIEIHIYFLMYFS